MLQILLNIHKHINIIFFSLLKKLTFKILLLWKKCFFPQEGRIKLQKKVTVKMFTLQKIVS